MQGPRIPPILPIVDAEFAEGNLQEVLSAFAAGGATWVEYRDKRADDRTFHRRAQELLAAARRQGLTLLINDRVDVALAIGAAAVHLGQEDLPPEPVRRLLGPEAIVGVSVGGLDEAKTVELLPVDYIALGPVFATATKPDAGEPVGLELIQAVRAESDVPLVGIGGITPDNAAEVTAAGADCVAAISSLLSAPDVTEATARLLTASTEGLRRRGVEIPEGER